MPRTAPELGDRSRRLAACLFAVLSLAAASRSPSDDRSGAEGLLVEGVENGFAADRAGLEIGDVLVSWRRGSGADSSAGAFRSLMDLWAVETEEVPQGEVAVAIRRDGRDRELRLAGDSWGIEAGEASSAAGFSKTDEEPLDRDRGLSAGGDRERLEHRAVVLRGMVASASGEALRGTVYEALMLADRLIAAGADESAVRLLVSVRESPGLDGAALSPFLLARLRDDLGSIDLQLGRFQEGAEQLEGALEVAGAAAPRSLRVAAIAARLGLALRDRGEYQAAGEHLESANELARSLAPGGMTDVTATANLGLLQYSVGNLGAAARHFEYAYLAIRDTENGSLPKILNSMGLTASRANDKAGAERYFRKAWEVQKRIDPGRCRNCAIYLYNLAGVEKDRENFEGAERYARESLRILDSAPENLFQRAAVLSSLAENVLYLGRPEDALPGLTEATEILRQVAPRAGFLAYNLSLLGRCLIELGRFDRAETILTEALGLAATISQKSQHHAYLLAALGRLEEERGRPRRALGHLMGAVEHYRSIEANSVEVALLAHRIGRLLLEQDDPAGAAEWSGAAIEALLEASPNVGGTLMSRTSFFGRTAEIFFFEVGQRLAREEREEAFELLESYRARVFREVLATRSLNLEARLPRGMLAEREATDRKYEEIGRRRAEAQARGDRPAVERWEGELREARAEREDVRARIAVELQRRTGGPHAAALEFREIRMRVGAGTLLLSFAVGEEGGYLFALGPGKDDFAVHSFPLGRDRLRVLVSQLRQALDAVEPPQLAFGLADRLSQLLLGAVGPAVGEAERVVILPDGPLYYLPFSLLADPSDELRRRRLGASKPLTIASSVVRGAERERSRGGGGRRSFVLFGDPVYPGQDLLASSGEAELVRSVEQGLRLSPLPETRREVQRLARLFGDGVEVYLGPEATEERANDRVSGADLVHFATHALVNERFPLESALALSIPREWKEGEANGLLQAWEIMEKMRLSADLVSLSACDTGLGREFAGEGLIGLTSAFQAAGASTVLASLWKVSDTQTARFMESFYRKLFSGQAKDEALRSARVDAMESSAPDFSHPSVWAAFQLYGDWR